MSYTALRVIESGVILFDGHQRRFANDPDALKAYRRFATDTSPGIYVLTWIDGRMEIQTRERSSIFDGIPVRYLPSPLTESVRKTAPPNPFSSLRVPGISTLLTSPSGDEIYESCSAAVIAWNGESLVGPPLDRPRLMSTAVDVIEVKRAPLRVDSTEPIALLNAIAGIVLPNVPGRLPFPLDVRDRVLAQILATAKRS